MATVLARCGWCRGSELYESYHDNEWGKPVHDERKMFEFLLLETFQAGLSWITVLKKREAFRAVFHQFEIARVANMTEKEIKDALQNARIIRHEAKIRAAITNAQCVLELHARGRTLVDFFWSYVDGTPVQNAWNDLSEIPAKTDLAVLFGNTDFRIYTILRDPELENLVLEKAHHFWHEHVLKDVPPPAQTPEDCQLLFQRSDPSKTLEANAETLALLERLQTLHYQGNACDEEITALKTQIMAQMQDAEVLAHQGQVLATWKAPKPSYRLDAKRLEAEERAIYEKYKVASLVSRRFVIKDSTQARAASH